MEERVQLYFEKNWSKHFISYPDSYTIELEWDSPDGEYITDRPRIVGKWNDGSEDYWPIPWDDID